MPEQTPPIHPGWRETPRERIQPKKRLLRGDFGGAGGGKAGDSSVSVRCVSVLPGGVFVAMVRWWRGRVASAMGNHPDCTLIPPARSGKPAWIQA